jgi:hypothetical protein
MRWYYILNADHTVSRINNLEEWALSFESCYSSIDWTGNDEIYVSTIFLGVDHGHGRTEHPILFETMVFGSAYNREQERYCTYDEAIEGHRKWCNLVFVRDGVGGLDDSATF